MKIFVKIKLKAQREGIKKISESEYEVSVHEPPEKGKANEAVRRLLAEHFGVAKSRVNIIAGHHSRAKIVEVI